MAHEHQQELPSFFLRFFRVNGLRGKGGFKQLKSLLGLAIYPSQANRQFDWRFPSPLRAATAQSAPSLGNGFCVLHVLHPRPAIFETRQSNLQFQQ